MFEPDIQAHRDALTREIRGRKVCVIGGAGSIGSSFIKAVLRFEPKRMIVVNFNQQ
jgi:FlaA1/EpsC-like NDP-sugar epimerase